MALALLLALVPAAQGQTTHDFRGTWDCCGSGGAPAQTWDITSMNATTGEFSGTGSQGSFTYPISGSATDDLLDVQAGPYENAVTGFFTGTISPDNQTMSGTWSDTGASSGTWTATRLSGPPSTTPGSPSTPGAPSTPGPGTTSPGGMPTQPLLGATLFAERKEKIDTKLGVVISCGVDPCVAEVDGVITVFPPGRPGKSRASARRKRFKLKRTKSLIPGRTARLVNLKVSPGKVRTVRRVLRRGGKARVTFKAKLTYGAGRTRRLERSARLTR